MAVATAADVAHFFVQQIVLRQGVSAVIMTDDNSHFIKISCASLETFWNFTQNFTNSWNFLSIT